MNQLRIGIVVLNYNTYDMVVKNVDILLSNNKCLLQIVILDNLSTDNSYEKLSNYYHKRDNVSIIQSPKNGGYSFGNNIGIKHLLRVNPEIEFVGIMNPDVCLDQQDLLLDLISCADAHPELAIIAPVLTESGNINLKKFGWLLPKYVDLLKSRMYIMSRLLKDSTQHVYIAISDDRDVLYTEVVQGSFFVIRSRDIVQADYFDEETFLYFEENILCGKIKRADRKVGIYIDGFYSHEHNFSRQTLKSRMKTLKHSIKSQDIYCRKELEVNVILRMILMFISMIYLYIEVPLGYVISNSIHKFKR